MRDTTQEQIDSYQSKVPTASLILTMLCMLVGMTAYEFLKQVIFPDITIWQSHIVTIVFSSSIATIIAYFVLRMRQLLLHRFTHEISRNKQMQEELMIYRNHLEELVKERTHELNEAIEQLQQKNAERKQAEEALRESEQRFKQITDNIHEIFWLTDPKSARMLYASPAYEDVWQAPVEDLYENPRQWMEFIHRDDRAIVIANQEKQARGQVTYEEFRIVRPDGSVRWIANRAYPIRDEMGEFYRMTGVAEDITERKRVEESLRESEIRYRELADSITDVFFAFDRDLRYTYWNKASENLTGIPAQDALGKSLYELFPDTLQTRKAARVYLDVLRTQQPQTFVNEYQLEGKDFIFEINAYPSRDGISVFTKDITERKRVEEALRSSEKELRRILEATTDGIWTWNFKTDKLFFSTRYYTMLGYKPNAFSANYENWVNLIHPNDRKKALSVAEEYLKTKPDLYENEFRLKTKKGDYQWIRTRARVVERDENGNAVYMIGNHEDITERKQTEEALRNSQEQLALIIDTLPALIGYIDSEQRYLYVNQRYVDWYGCSKDELVGKHLKEVVYEKSYQGLIKHVQAVLQGQEVSFENISYDLEGQLRAVKVTYAPHFDENGQVKAFLGLVQDITEQKRAEEQLKKSLKEKEVLLQELYHRTKNNMNVIGAMLSMQAEDLDDQRLSRVVEEIKQRILSMAMVHEQLYESQDLSHVNLRAYTRQLADSLLVNYHIGPGNIALKVDVEPIVVLIETAIPYGLMVNELMTNALKYAFPDDRDGEIRIGLRRLSEEGKEFELRFCDNGVGLSKDLDIRKTTSFGMKLITLLAEMQLRGTVDLQVNNGTEFRIQFQELNYKARV